MNRNRETIERMRRKAMLAAALGVGAALLWPPGAAASGCGEEGAGEPSEERAKKAGEGLGGERIAVEADRAIEAER